MKFSAYEVVSDALCMGERVKGGRYKPCSETFRYSQLTGMLKRAFGISEVHAAGFLKSFRIEYLSHTITDRSRDISKVPLRVEFLTDVIGVVYISEGAVPKDHENKFTLRMGAMISKGFGICRLKKIGGIDVEKETTQIGFLNTRLPVRAVEEGELDDLMKDGRPTRFLLDIFGVRRILQPHFGYLADPGPDYGANYILALFEKSKVEAPAFLIR